MGLVNFEMPTVNTSIIKVIGVGGGGSNAVNYMFRQGITDVSFVVCNTDDQALKKSPVPIQIQLGANITEGLGAGSHPEVARQAAIESLPQIEEVLNDNTKMAFITAGMGGGTGTGAAPVIAEAASKLGILTVGIVTIPFAFEGKRKIMQALEGVRQMSKHVDAILIINNEKLREVYPDLELSNAFAKADDILTQAAKGIAEIITVEGYINVDFADVYTIMKDGGVAVMNTGYAEGEKRITHAIENALNSPLLNNHNIHESKKILLSLYCSTTNKILMEETTEINEFMEQMGEDIEVIWGVTFDEDLGDGVKITLIATGFSSDVVPEEVQKEDEEEQEENNKQPSENNVSIPQPHQTDARTKWMKQLYSPTGTDEPNMVLDDMDDDDLFKEMENIPAYKRK
ncbi:MAG: cell division protein FtsZ [Paludibacteraceae bacterium]|jgi:cell division protein FtsZ|nr:cell division protein FtsZ [Paludibacteraceae bacterium]